MGCGVSRPETEEGGNARGGGAFKMITNHRSIHSGVVADSFTLSQQFLEIPSDSDGCVDAESRTKKEKDGTDMESCRGSSKNIGVRAGDYVPENSILLCPGSPSFRIYCDILPYPLDHHHSDQASRDSSDRPASQKPQNQCQPNVKKEEVRRRREARRTRIGRRIKNVGKILTGPVASDK